MIDMTKVFLKISDVLTEEEIGSLLAERLILAYLLDVEFNGEYTLSGFEINSMFKDAKYANVCMSKLPSGELIVRGKIIR